MSSNSRIIWLWLITIFPERMAGSIKEFPFKKPIYDSERTAGCKVMRATTFDSHVSAMDITIQKKKKFITTDKHKKVKDERLATSFSKIKERSKLLEMPCAAKFHWSNVFTRVVITTEMKTLHPFSDCHIAVDFH